MKKREIVFSYYELWVMDTEKTSSCHGRYTDLAAAKEDMKNHGNYYRPLGTGRIYRVDLFENPATHAITVEETQVYEKD
jgi:hypothetical protein